MTAETLFAVPDDGGMLLQLADLTRRVEYLEGLLEEALDAPGYQPVPAPRWWELTGEDRAAAIEPLSEWVQTVYVPGYGKLSSQLPVCWREHNAILFVLDFLSELHSWLYLRDGRGSRTLTEQAEFTLRLLPAAVDMMRSECAGVHTHGGAS